MNDQYQFWRDALTGKFGPIHDGEAQSGFYKDRATKGAPWIPVAVWTDEDGTQWCLSNGEPVENPSDRWTWFCRHPITAEAYQAALASGSFPDAIEPAGIGHNSAELAPHEALDAEIIELQDRAHEWIKSIGGKIETKEHADKAANYADAFAKLSKRASETHKSEKEPHLKAGRDVDARWKPLAEKADTAKTWMKRATDVFLIAENERIKEQARLAAEEARKQAEAARVTDDAPIATTRPAAPAPVAIGTSGKRIALREYQVVEIADLPAFIGYLAAMDPAPPDLVEVAQKIARRMVSAGVTPPGITTKTEQRAA